MQKQLKILMVEDSPLDAELLVRQLKRAGYEPDWHRVDHESAYRTAIEKDWDLIVSDYTLPGFSTQQALEILLQSGRDIPFVVVSGTIGEERAVEILKAGATDYVLKDHLQRLGGVVDRARRDFELRRERLKMEEQLRFQSEALLRAQRLESIGTLAGGIAHDLNNSLAPILMSIEVLETKLYDPESTQLLQILRTSAQRGADMVKQLLTFSKGIQGGPTLLQLRHLLREIQTVTRRTFPKKIRVELQLPKDLWPILGDVTQLHQVLMNLTVNARDAMPDGGTLKIVATNQVIDEQFASMNAEAHAGPYVIISVSDSGSGIAPGVRERIFEPFFTTKEPEKGTGLGLPIVQGIVRAHRGFIVVESELGKGTEFRVYLPARTSDIPVPEAPEDSVLASGQGELILVVEDEEAVRVLSKKTLEAFGYDVITANDGAQAVALCAREAGKIHLMLTDMSMPIMDGPATIRAARLVSPQIRIIACSGLGSEAVKARPAGADSFLSKPFTARQLLKAIRELLDAPSVGPNPPGRVA